jgi:pSer/pThr/pTyr-binding forkhead associated (FHA) protein
VQVWEATVVADRAYYDRLDANGISFPAICPERRFKLSGERLVIGRRSVSRGIQPEIDLSGPAEDVGVSHMHAILVGATGGGWTIIDPGSANGTFLNDGADPIPTNQAVELSEGDQIHIGAWTTLKLSARSGS